jgi:hypothetical protein
VFVFGLFLIQKDGDAITQKAYDGAAALKTLIPFPSHEK